MIKPWKLLQEETAFQNKFVKIDKRVYELPNGRTADYFIRDGMGNVASIWAVTSDQKFILAQEFRPGPNMIMDELAGGVVDSGENPLEAAQRELLEETGYQGEFIFLGETYLSAYSRSKKYCYLALNCKKVAERTGAEHENEFIEVILKDKQQLLEQVDKGDLTDLDTALMGLNYLEKHQLL